VGTFGHADRGQGWSMGVADWSRLPPERLGGQVRWDVVQEQGDVVRRRAAGAFVTLAPRLLVAGVGPPVVRRLAWPWDHPGHQDQQVHRQPVADSGAVKPPNDWATTTRSARSPMASTTVSAYSGSPAESSSEGRSGATTS
jgi:hypothetical protein